LDNGTRGLLETSSLNLMPMLMVPAGASRPDVEHPWTPSRCQWRDRIRTLPFARPLSAKPPHAAAHIGTL
jgi:hypothetical protein